MKHLRSILTLLLAAALWVSVVVLPVSAAEDGSETITMTPMYGEPIQPEGMSFAQVSFIIPDTQGLTKDGWDNNIEHNEDLILISYVKDGVEYQHQTVKEIKAAWGEEVLKRTCYTYDDPVDGKVRLNLVLHMDAQDILKPTDITLVTVKAGFVWCVGSPAGITGEMPSLTLDHDVSFFASEAGITAVQLGQMPGGDGAICVRFDRKDSESLKAISAVDLCPSAVPGKTLGDLVTINGETVTELVAKGNVARFNFYGDMLIFHIDDPAYLATLKAEHYEIVINPGFRWMNWDKDDWGNWAGTRKNDYTPVDGTLVIEPLSFYLNENNELCMETDGISVVPGYKDTYYVGDSLDMTTLLVNINYADGTVEETPILENMCEYDFSQPGTAEVKITLKGMTTSYTVTVLEKVEETEPETDPATEPETDPATEPVTDPVTEPVTKAEDPDDSSETDPAEGGCSSAVLSVSALGIPVAAGAALVLRKKRD